MRPVIGILGNILNVKSGITPMDRNFTNDSCVKSIYENGGVPIILPVVKESQQEAFNLCDGFLFPGGGDINPIYYGEKQTRTLTDVRKILDEFSFSAANYAITNKIPVLGICRGMQLLNVACGGTLYQDIPGHRQRTYRYLTSHNVIIESDSRLHEILGEKNISVNSLHHQAVKDIAKNLKISASADDGIIEGLESDDGLIIAVQWHPEDLIYTLPVMNKLFADLIERAGKHNGD